MPDSNQYNNFQVDENGFYHKGELFRFGDIAHIFFTRIHTTQRINFMEVGGADSAHLHLTLNSGPVIKLSFDEAGIFIGFNKDKSEDISNLSELYLFLSKKTFDSRLGKYVKQLEAKGYFEYDECKFYPKKKAIVFRNKSFRLKTHTLIKISSCVEIRKRDFGLLDKLKREVSFKKIPQFNTQTDTDVIFTLLSRYFGLEWD